MSPEQLRGQPADYRIDIFVLGTILYEMLAGQRAFQRPTPAETMSAILNEDPPAISSFSPMMQQVVQRCLEKAPAERFQSASDLAFALEALSDGVWLAGFGSWRNRRRRKALIFGVASLAAVTAAGLLANRRRPTTAPVYHRLTFRQGTIQGARFAPDGQSVVYSAAWDGGEPQIFITRPQSPESRPLGLGNSTLLGVSPKGEIAVSLGTRLVHSTFSVGELARVPMEGGAPREIVSNVESADWSVDGSDMLLTRQVAGRDHLEFPLGQLIFESGGAVGHPRFSPQHDRIAFFDHSGWGSDDGSVAVVDLSGKKTILSSGWADLTGLAWSPNGDEVWFTGDRDNGPAGLDAVNLAQHERKIEQVPGDLVLFDTARDGRVLLGREEWRGGIYGLSPDEIQERDLSWFDYSVVSDLSADGRTMLFQELGEAAGARSATYLRRTNGLPAVRLWAGLCEALSRDGKRVLCVTPDNQLAEVPTQAGERKLLTHDQLIHVSAQWFPNDEQLVFLGKEAGQGLRLYTQNLLTGQLKAITPPGATRYYRLSPNGDQLAVAMGEEYRTFVYSVAGSDPAPLLAGC